MLSPAEIRAWTSVELLVPGITRSGKEGKRGTSPMVHCNVSCEKGAEDWAVQVPKLVTIFCTNTPAFCRQLTGNPPRLDPEPEESEDAWRGIMGTGVDWTGWTLATGFSSARGGGRL